MARIWWGIICQKATIDSRENNVSLIGVIEEMTVIPPKEAETVTPDKPALIPVNYDFVILAERSNPDEAESPVGKFTICGPTDKGYGSGEFKLDLSETRRARAIAHLDFFAFAGPGEYYFKVEILNDETGDYTEVYRTPLIVKTEALQSS